jgi:hypothetical protein
MHNMENSSTKTWMSKIFTQTNWKRLSMIGVPLLLLAALITGGIFATSASAAGPQVKDKTSNSSTSKNDGSSNSSAPKDETVTGTIIKIDAKGTLLTVRNFQGRGQTMVHVNRNTKFVSKGMGRKNAFRDLKVGDFIQAIGPRNKDRDRSIEAKLIIVSKQPKNS